MRGAVGRYTDTPTVNIWLKDHDRSFESMAVRRSPGARSKYVAA
jgi:hypothetical protein